MWGGKECFVATEVKNGVKQMNDSNEREGKCFVVLEGMFFFFLGGGGGVWGKEEGLRGLWEWLYRYPTSTRWGLKLLSAQT